jgi:light-regulated signal transduction histidine kinase (bacteriophytochrome)
MNVTPLENAFSSTLGEGTRWLQEVLLTVMLVSTAAFLGITLFIAFLISRHLCAEIDRLRAGASRVAGGDYNFTLETDSQDEIGDLTRSFQEMMNQRREVVKLKDEFYAGIVAANKELEAFSYSVSHDLRAPLRAIDGFSKELLTNCEDRLDERGKDDLRRIRAATQRMGQLIDDLLELSRLTRSELKFETVDLSTQVQDIEQKLAASDPQRQVEYVTAPDLTAAGDPHLLQIALENLLQNSWKFTRPRSRPKIEFGVLNQNGDRTYFIRDNGVGFNMAYAEKLFKPFQRLHDSKEFPGTGIGLALVQRIIYRHGGKVWVEAEENKGATFYFTLS